MRTHPRRPVRAVAAAVALLALSSCSDDADKSPPQTHPTPTSDSSRAPSGDNGNLNEPVGARADLRDFECDAEGGAWSASGKLENAARKPVTYLVRVSLSDGDAGTVLGTAEHSVTVDAKGSARVKFAEFHSGDPKGSCVARVVKSS